MKNKMTIRIKDPKLRLVRNELRRLLQEIKSARLHEILSKKWELKHSEGYLDKDHPDHRNIKNKIQELTNEQNKLIHIFDTSIVYCRVCMKLDKDMTYNPVLKEWFCMECYEANRRFEIAQGRPDLYS